MSNLEECPTPVLFYCRMTCMKQVGKKIFVIPIWSHGFQTSHLTWVVMTYLRIAMTKKMSNILKFIEFEAL